MNRAEALRWWRSGYGRAGRLPSANTRPPTMEKARRQLPRPARPQPASQTDALLLETIAAFASLFSKNNPSSPSP